jgi:hypothetical protein
MGAELRIGFLSFAVLAWNVPGRSEPGYFLNALKHFLRQKGLSQQAVQVCHWQACVTRAKLAEKLAEKLAFFSACLKCRKTRQ